MFAVPIRWTTNMYLLFKQAVCYTYYLFNFILIVTFVCFVALMLYECHFAQHSFWEYICDVS